VSRAGLLAVRIALLLAAGGALVLASDLARRRAQSSQPRFACPMHPAVRGTGPAPCPICGMALQRPGGPVPVPEQARVRPTSLVVADPIAGPAWVEGGAVVSVLYDDEIRALRPDEQALFRPGRIALRRLPGQSPWDAGTSLVRWRPAGPAAGTGWVELAPRAREVTVLPYRSVLNRPGGNEVLVVQGGALVPRRIGTGRTAYDFATVVSGLAGDETVVGGPAALFDAERRLGAAR
jgi:hypothetical protein